MSSILSVSPSQCLVFEDSKSGIAAAMAAGMTVVTVPESSQYSHIEFDSADLKTSSLLDLHAGHILQLESLLG